MGAGLREFGLRRIADRRAPCLANNVWNMSTKERAIRFGGEIDPGHAVQVVLVFDVPLGVVSWMLRANDQTTVPFSLPVVTSERIEVTRKIPFQAEMNGTVTLHGIDIVPRASVRGAISISSQPAPFVPGGEYVVVYLAVTNAGAAEYDTCPPNGPRCVGRLWFELADAAGNVYRVEPIAWTASSMMNPDLLPFGSLFPSNIPEPMAPFFDASPGEKASLLVSTPDAPRAFPIRVALSEAPGSVLVVRTGGVKEAATPSAPSSRPSTPPAACPSRWRPASHRPR